MFIFHLSFGLHRESKLGVGAKPKQVEYGDMKKRWILNVMEGPLKDFPSPFPYLVVSCHPVHPRPHSNAT